MKRIVYKISVLNWEKHQPKMRKGFEYFMVSNRFFDNHKVATLTSLERLLYLAILSRCADERSANISPTRDQLLTMLGQRRYDIATALIHLEENQLVTVEKNASLININKENINKENINKFPKRSEIIQKTNHDKNENKLIWETYLNAYRLRWGVEPVRNATVNTQISNLRKKLGTEDACKVIEFYLKHNDSWYLKHTHAIGLCLKDAETLRTQMLRNQPITQAKIKTFEKMALKAENDAMIENLWSDENAK